MTPERVERLAKMVCGALVVLIVVKLTGLGRAQDHLRGVKVPSLASLKSPMAAKETKPTATHTRPSLSSRSSSPPVPDNIKARVDVIYQSEIFGPVPHPLPMAVLGIIGDEIILRTASGQTGLVAVGKELGGVKVLEIGINRVLIEEDGTKKELTLHNGFGGESLLKPEPPKQP